MSATEYLHWQVYFGLFPFTHTRADWQHAEILSTIINDGLATRAQAAGKTSYTAVDVIRFVPDYLGERVKKVTDPLQRDEYAAFAAKLKAAQG